jgi:hypothetical protein
MKQHKFEPISTKQAAWAGVKDLGADVFREDVCVCKSSQNSMKHVYESDRNRSESLKDALFNYRGLVQHQNSTKQHQTAPNSTKQPQTAPNSTKQHQTAPNSTNRLT